MVLSLTPPALFYFSSAMPILPPSQEQASGAGPSAGITVGATIGGIILLSLVIFLVFFLRRRRDQSSQEMGRKNSIFFNSGPEAARDRLIEKETETQASHSRNESDSSSTPLLTSPDSASSTRPLVPRITIPSSSPLMKSAFMDTHASAIYSACMNSSDSVYSQFSASSPAPAPTFHAGPTRHRPTHTVTQQRDSVSAMQPYGLPIATSAVTAAARPIITPARPRRSLHPFSGAQLITSGTPDPSRMHMQAIMELPSPFIFGAAPGAGATADHRGRARQDSLPVSPMSKLSEELDEFIEALPAPLSAAGQYPETPASAAYDMPLPESSAGHVSPLQIRRRNGP
ncbi:hypothetical protein B0H19DRAFT_1110805 [Mycena capillaripes]|nr:hypothetical protein B0H19DRAFT_1110805 [Mycena capillaripes]